MSTPNAPRGSTGKPVDLRLEERAGVEVPEVLFHFLNRHVSDVVMDATAVVEVVVDVSILRGFIHDFTLADILRTVKGFVRVVSLVNPNSLDEPLGRTRD